MSYFAERALSSDNRLWVYYRLIVPAQVLANDDKGNLVVNYK